MSIKPHISNRVPPTAVRSRIAAEFRELVAESLLRAPSYTVISFPGMRGHSTSIVDSKSLKKALRTPPPAGDRLLVVAHAFTAEALEILSELDAVCFSGPDFHWTDASWARIRDT
ncbi:hypothetical protein ACFJIW_15290 [Tahibacter sp. UC22_41]|uniref:hypothetical protein n=1 Tax=Tahibacter sp. UC22_41 TaxID=3350178 RepID=UPI0036D7D73C